MDHSLLGLGAIVIGVLHIAAAHKEWGWYVNSWQVKPILQSHGLTTVKLYTYLMCSPLIGWGIYTLFKG